MAKRRGIYYGWVVLVVGVIIMTTIYGIRNTFGVFFPSILEHFGWTRASTALMLSIAILVYGFVAPLAGSLGDRLNPRRVMAVSLVALSLVTVSCGLASELWQFYLIYGVLAPVFSAFAGWPIFVPVLSRWFTKKRGLVMGLGQMGVALSFTYGMFAQVVIAGVGWQRAYFVLAGILLVVALPLCLLFYYRPGETRHRVERAEPAAAPDITSPDWTLRRALRVPQLWFLVVSQFFFWGLGGYLLVAHQVKFAEDVGFSSAFAAGVFALYGLFMVGGFLGSIFSDWISREGIITIATALGIGAVIALLMTVDTSRPWLLYAYAAGMGLGMGLYAPTTTAAMTDIFHGRHLGAIAALLLTGMGLGAAIGPWLGGYIFDATGSYRLAFLLCIASFALSSLAFWLAAPRKADKLRARVLAAYPKNRAA
ncbi:MAG: MFS transporter [Chloroflexi bacterium]|nr:MFS transporter [Chloroflexota bacterium]